MAPTSIRKIEHGSSLRDRISRSLSAAIVSGELALGALVTVPTLAQQFDVSATPVREALLDLKHRGFVSSVRNKGFRVTEVSSGDLREIVELRQLLEAPVMRALAGHVPAEKMRHWRGVADRVATHARKGELAEFIETDKEFHLGLFACKRRASDGDVIVTQHDALPASVLAEHDHPEHPDGGSDHD